MKKAWGYVLVIFFVLLVVIAGLGVFIYIKYQPPELPLFEIGNFFGQVQMYSAAKGTWEPANRGGLIRHKDKIRTGPGSEIDFSFPGKIFIRLKENSELEYARPQWFAKELPFSLLLQQGALLAAVEKDFDERALEIRSPAVIATAHQGSLFRVALEKTPYGSQKAWVGVLRGEVQVQDLSRRQPQVVVLRSLQKSEALQGTSPSPSERFSTEDWNAIKEAYELIQKSAVTEAQQLDLSKKAGSLFQHVFDHGTFYTPKIGFANREFIQDEATGEVYLYVEYDVFPKGSFVGVYMKTRDFDISKFDSLKFQVKRDPEEGVPDSFRMELKSGSGVIRAFAPTQFKQSWETFELPLKFSKAAPVNEITVVFTNEKVGEHKKGILYFKDFQLTPLTIAPPEPVAVSPAAPAVKEVPLVALKKAGSQ